MNTSPIQYRYIIANNIKIFYREAGLEGAPVLLLLHGYPTSSHMFRNLIPLLSEKYHIIAPDLPGFGYSDAPATEQFQYTFDNFAKIIQEFINKLGLTRFAMYVFDYGAPVGWRLAMANPEKITGIISQNGNAYEEGLSENWAPIKDYWKTASDENRNRLKSLTTLETTKWQYEYGVEDLTHIAPESYTLDQAFLDRPGNIEIQLDLFKDYSTNVRLYPEFQSYFRSQMPPFLAVWGEKDPFFLPAGAEAFKRDIPNATVRFFNTGHFALETHVHEIAIQILKFLEKLPE